MEEMEEMEEEMEEADYSAQLEERVDYVYIADFTEKDRDLLLEYLWYSTCEVINAEELFDFDKAKYQVNYNEGYAYIICGRKIELYIYNVDAIDMYMYDHHNGIGSVQDIANEVRYSNSLQKKTTINGIEELFLDIRL